MIWLQDFSEVALEGLLLARVFRGQNFYFAFLEPDVKARLHAARNIRESDALVDTVFEERDGSVASIIQDAKPGGHFLAFAAVAENSARLQPVLVDTYKFLGPHVPVDARW